MEALQKQLTYYAAGETVALTVQRQNGSGEYSEVSVDVTLGDKSAINSYENGQQSQEGGRSYGYSNDKNSQDNQKEDSADNGSADTGKSKDSGESENKQSEEDKKSENSENSDRNESPYYSFFNDIFGNN